jgi:hypothetical protein
VLNAAVTVASRSGYPVGRHTMLALVLQPSKHGRSRFRSAIYVFFVTASVGVLLAGCGSSYTKADFVHRANGICLSTTRAERLLTPPEFSGTDAQKQQSVSAYLARVSGLVRTEAGRLRALPTPPGRPPELKLLNRWLAAVRASASGLQVLGAAEKGGNRGAITAATAALAALPVVTLASRYGAKDCAGPGATYSFSGVTG